MSILEVSNSRIVVDAISSNVVISSDFLNSISEKHLELISDAIRYLTLSREKKLNPNKFNHYFVGFEVDHIEISEDNYPNDRNLKIYMSSGFLFYRGIFFIPEIEIPVTLKYRVPNPNPADAGNIPYVYSTDEEINLYFNVIKIMDSYKEPRDIFDGKDSIKKLVSSAITYDIKVNKSSTVQNDEGYVQFGKVSRKNIYKIETDFQSYNRNIISTETTKKKSRQLKEYFDSESSRTKLDYFKKFKVGEIYKLNHPKHENGTESFPFISGDTPLSLVDKTKTPDFYEYLNNYKLPFSIEVDGFFRNAFPRNSSGKCTLTLLFNLKRSNNVILKTETGTELLPGNIIPYLFSMIPMHPVRTPGMENQKFKMYNDHHFGTNNRTNRFTYLGNSTRNGVLSYSTIGKIDANYTSFGQNLHSDSMPEKSKGIVIQPIKVRNDNVSGTPISIVGNTIKRLTPSNNDSAFDDINQVDFSRSYFMTAFNGSERAIQLYRDESSETNVNNATHLGVTIDDFCYLNKGAIQVSFLYDKGMANSSKFVIEFYPYKIPKTPHFEFIPANLPWAKGLLKPVNSTNASALNTNDNGGFCHLDNYSLTRESSDGTPTTSVWYCNGYEEAPNLLKAIKEIAFKYMTPSTLANNQTEVFSQNSQTKKIIYTGHSALDGNNKPSILIPDSNGLLTETRVENTILDMGLRHSKVTGGVWKFVYPRLILPLFYRQKDDTGADANPDLPYAHTLVTTGFNPDVARSKNDIWKTFAFYRPATFVWMNGNIPPNIDFAGIVRSPLINNPYGMDWLLNNAGGYWVWAFAFKVGMENRYNWVWINNHLPQRNRTQGEPYDPRSLYFTFYTAYAYNLIRIHLQAQNFDIFNGLWNNSGVQDIHNNFGVPLVNANAGENLYRVSAYDSMTATGRIFYRGSTCRLPSAWLEEYKRGNSELFVYMTGLHMNRSIFSPLFSNAINSGYFQAINSVMDLGNQSFNDDAFSQKIQHTSSSTGRYPISNCLYPFYSFSGSLTGDAGSILYVASMATDTPASSTSNEHTFIFPLERERVVQTVDGNYPFPIQDTNDPFEVWARDTFLKPTSLKEMAKNVNVDHIGSHLSKFTNAFMDSSNPIDESIGFRWTGNSVSEYFRYYSLMVIEEFKKKNDLSSMYFIGVDLEKISNPGERYAVWYPNRNFLGAKDIDDYIVDVTRSIARNVNLDEATARNFYSPEIQSFDNSGEVVLDNSDKFIPKLKYPDGDNLFNPLEILSREFSRISSNLNNGIPSEDIGSDDVVGLISSGGITIRSNGEVSNSFLQTLGLWGVDSALILYKPSEFFIKKQGGNDWILTLPNDVQSFNSVGTSVSGNSITELHSMRVKENLVRKDLRTVRYAIAPYGKMDGFSYIYIGRIL